MTRDELIAALVLGIVEGVTEFLPVSSTGHLIVAGHWLGFSGERAKTFEIFIQLGAILAIVWIYRARLATVARSLPSEPRSRRFVTNLLLGLAPAATLGILFHRTIKQSFFVPEVVAAGFIAGGVAILAIERWRPIIRVEDAADLEPRTALGIGVAQILALLPGVSRSGATILGAYALGLSRTAATEFSFFLAVPVIVGAAFFDLFRSLDALRPSDAPLFAVGLVVSFLSAMLVVRVLLRFVAHHSFRVFAWYRIAFGLLLLWLLRIGPSPLA